MAKHVLFSSFSLLAALAAAQPSQQVTVTGRIIGAPLDVGGFGDTPLARSPFAASSITSGQLLDAGARNISDLTRLDAAITDAYNAEGYWNFLTVRGFVLDNRYNYRRDGLPINAETVIPLHNKSGVEVLKGTSGIQAGTSAPGGLANFAVKRPTGTVRSATVGWQQRNSWLGAVDVGQRFGADQMFGVRVNASHERLDPLVRDAKGERSLFALAADWRPTLDSALEAEVEASRQSQPSVPGFSLLGDTLPDAATIDPRINLNNQPWTLPVVLDGRTASLRWRHALTRDWSVGAHAMTQRLENQDRIAFPFGVFDAESYDCPQWCDRFAPDGTFTVWEFQSDNERRRSDAFDLSVAGTLATGPLRHTLQTGVLFTRHRARFEQQVFDIAGTGNIAGTAVVPRAPGFPDENTDRDERGTEFYLRDLMQLSERFSVWAGLRHSRIDRESVRTDGSRPTAYKQSFTTPWLALAHQTTPQTMFYASWGQGIESDVAPNRARYTNRGEPLPALKSRQVELGVKHDGDALDASAALFDIDRPVAEDIGACDVDASCTRTIDGSARHRGIEALVSWRSGPWQLHTTAMWLDAERRGSVDPARNGQRPTNVAERTLRVQLAHELGALPGLSLSATLVHEGDRVVLPYDTSVRIPSWNRVDLGARYSQRVGGARLTWRLGVDNVADERAWKEAPYQFGHAYLFPMPPRTWRLSVQGEL